MSCLPGICTISLGRAAAGHTLTEKLDMASKHGFKGIELFHEDLVSIAQRKRGTSKYHPSVSTRRPRIKSNATRPFTPAEEVAAAYELREMCQQRGLSIICLQPFWQYEGLLNRYEHKEQLTRKLPLWFRLCEALGTDMIQVPSNFLPADQLSCDPNVAIQDLRDMADAGLAFAGQSADNNNSTDPTDSSMESNDSPTNKTPIRFAYEALAWGTHTSTWESAYATVLAVDRPNFGLLLDTFNIAASTTFADPSSPTGMVDNAHEKITASLEKLVSEVDVSRVSYVQIASAERLAKPLREGHQLWDAEQNVRMSWSRNCRLFYGEEGVFVETKDRDEVVRDNGLHHISPGERGNAEPSIGFGNIDSANGLDRGFRTLVVDNSHISPEQCGAEYLPISQICSAIFNDLGFRGWVSMEVFHRETWNAENPDVPRDFARRGMVSWHKLKSEFGLATNPSAELDCICGCGAGGGIGSGVVTAVGDGSATESGGETGSESDYVAVCEVDFAEVIVGGCESAEDADDEDDDEDNVLADGAVIIL